MHNVALYGSENVENTDVYNLISNPENLLSTLLTYYRLHIRPHVLITERYDDKPFFLIFRRRLHL